MCVPPAIHAVRRDPELQRFYRRKLVQKGMGKARMAAARKLGIRLWIEALAYGSTTALTQGVERRRKSVQLSLDTADFVRHVPEFSGAGTSNDARVPSSEMLVPPATVV